MPRTLRVAILECDTPLDDTRAKYGGYGGVFTALLKAAASRLTERGTPITVTTEAFDVVKGAYPDLKEGVERWDGLLLTGSRFSAYEDVPWIKTLIAKMSTILKEPNAAATPKLIGACFGHQILGMALDTPVERNPLGWELSVSPVALTPLGKELFTTSDTMQIFQMHRDILVRLPDFEGIQSLGASERCAVQGMYIPGKLISVQGHPEFTADIVTEILVKRHELGILDDEQLEDAMARTTKKHDGVEIAVAYLEFLLNG